MLILWRRYQGGPAGFRENPMKIPPLAIWLPSEGVQLCFRGWGGKETVGVVELRHMGVS